MPHDNQARMKRGNQMFDALKKETDRGKACVGDAMLDELLKELFAARFVNDLKIVNEALGDGQPLGNHGVRLKVAYLLGWIGPDTYQNCKIIHKVRNKMAHLMDIDSFDHPTIAALLDKMPAQKSLLLTGKKGLQQVNIKRREDRFTIAIVSAMLQIWQFIADSKHAESPKDLILLPMPRPHVTE
jgi:DNA-binding MltR family transcriptional regulator